MRKELQLKKARRRSWWLMLLAFSAGAASIIGVAFAMTTTDKAGFCGSCHAMSEAALTHKSSVHAKLACNECHAPHNLVKKIPFKTKEGARDIFSTATSTIPDLIHPGGETLEVVQVNCRRCHEAGIQTVNMEAKAHCTDCHRHVPHSPKLPIAKRSAADA
ncbi:MAG: 7-cyano-7-deazaguanine reductase [Desulfobacteraceae bacterium]|nr:MAG: 7-cyano-7-deazaguanine reductase [Desulfobacteraceae bacterium]